MFYLDFKMSVLKNNNISKLFKNISRKKKKEKLMVSVGFF